MRSLTVGALQDAFTAVASLVQPSTFGTYSGAPTDSSDMANLHALVALEGFWHIWSDRLAEMSHLNMGRKAVALENYLQAPGRTNAAHASDDNTVMCRFD